MISRRTKYTQTPLLQLFQNKHSHFQTLTGVFPPKTNTETNIYRVMKIQQKSPGHKVSPPVPKISGLRVLNRMSHLLCTVGQETLGPKRMSPRMYYQDKSHIFSRKVFTAPRKEWNSDNRNAGGFFLPSGFFLICQYLQKRPKEPMTTLSINPLPSSTAQSVVLAVGLTTLNNFSFGCLWERHLFAFPPECPGCEQVSKLGHATGEWLLSTLLRPPFCVLL